MLEQSAPPASTPHIERVRFELKQRSLSVKAIDPITPNMLRITLIGEDLADFQSAAPDDHIKIFPGGVTEKRDMRDYTPRSFDPENRTLVIDFAVHDAGPATLWALNAKVGDTLAIGGPRGSLVISGVERWVLIGDETALPAIGRRIEEADAGTRIIGIMTVADATDEQQFETQAALEIHWVHRPLTQATDASGIIAALDQVDLDPKTFVWVASEASVARRVRRYLVNERGHPLGWIRASGYWMQGKADTHETIED